VLDSVVCPLVRSSLTSGAADSWFFLRYADPHWHLRLRLHGEPGRLSAEVLPALQAAVGPLLETGQLWRMQLDTYEREVERYGGERGVELAEAMFAADSDAVLTVLGSLSGDAGLDLRWRVALAGIDLLFDDLGLTPEQKRTSARRQREGLGREFAVDGPFRAQVGRRFRTERARLEALLDGEQDPSPSVVTGLEALRRRSAQLVPVTAELRRLVRGQQLSTPMTDLAASYAHMHVNRLLRSAHRAQELVLYELLDRAYSARAGRRAGVS
jgi:thiopeptide-type bacteriocin biosynthesis protein